MKKQKLVVKTAISEQINGVIREHLAVLGSGWEIVSTSTHSYQHPNSSKFTMVTVTIVLEQTSGSRAQKERPKVDEELLAQPISILKLPTLIEGALRQGSIETLRDLIGKNCRELIKFRNFSNLSLYRVIEALAEKKLYLGYKTS